MRIRPRRLRGTPAMRRLVAQTRLHPADLVLPMFVIEADESRPIASMPGVVQHSMDSLRRAATEAAANGWIDRDGAIVESVTAIKRAGADAVLTYWAVELAARIRATE